MKKKFLGSIIALVFAAVVGWNYLQDKQNLQLSDLTLENVEALAGCEQTVGGSCWWSDGDFKKCCEGGWYGCAPCE